MQPWAGAADRRMEAGTARHCRGRRLVRPRGRMTEFGQIETFGGDAKLSRKRTAADGHEALLEGVVWLGSH